MAGADDADVDRFTAAPCRLPSLSLIQPNTIIVDPSYLSLEMHNWQFLAFDFMAVMRNIPKGLGCLWLPT